MRRKEFIIIHHVGAKTKKASQNYRGNHYDFLILNGKAVQMRDLDRRGAHCLASNMNTKALSISFADNLSLAPPSEADLKEASKKTKELMKRFKIPIQNVLGHGEVRFAKTQCPGKYMDMNKFRKSLINTKFYNGSIPCTIINFCKLYPVLKARYTGQSIKNDMFTIQIFNAPEKEKMWIDNKVKELINAKVYWEAK